MKAAGTVVMLIAVSPTCLWGQTASPTASGSGPSQPAASASLTAISAQLHALQGEIATTMAQISKNGQSAESSRSVEEELNSALRTLSSSFAVIYGGSNKALYGPDDRKDYDNVNLTASQRLAADTTAALIKSNKFTLNRDGNSFSLPSGNVIDGPTGRGLCTPAQSASLNVPEEPFYNEANPAFCSAFKIGPELVATAGHCIRTAADCASTKIVFGFHITDADPHPEQDILMRNIYSCKKVLGGSEGTSDWRVVQVDRVIDAPQVQINLGPPSPPVTRGLGVTVVGYPLGLPVKIADNAQVRSVSNSFFVANLDTYEGNSGSAVFDTAQLLQGELLVDGILVRGESDFSISSPCFASKRCPVDGCRGEDVTLSKFLQAFVHH